MIYLKIYDSNGINFYLKKIEKKSFKIGRSEEADLQIGDNRVSKEHCLLEEKDGRWMLSDLNSINGVFDGERRRVDALELAEGHVFYLGDQKIAVSFNAFQKEKTQEIVLKKPSLKGLRAQGHYTIGLTLFMGGLYLLLSVFNVWVNYLGKKNELFKSISLELLGQLFSVFFAWLLLVVIAKVFSGALRTKEIFFELCAFFVFVGVMQNLYYAFAWVSPLEPFFYFLKHFKLFLGFVVLFRATLYHNNFLRCVQWGLKAWVFAFLIQLGISKAYDPYVGNPVLENHYSATGWSWGAASSSLEDLKKTAKDLYEEGLEEE